MDEVAVADTYLPDLRGLKAESSGSALNLVATI